MTARALRLEDVEIQTVMRALIQYRLGLVTSPIDQNILAPEVQRVDAISERLSLLSRLPASDQPFDQD